MDVVSALLPPVGVLLLFIVVIRAFIQGDRRERAALARMEKERRDSPDEGDAPR
ncbi:hypothetical protein [Kineococcus xinjiangensis]|uniref:hypothetical protein n=1 Tax=Kineococcus xinjiangensis TaxID=512762 RepID=UPI0014745CA6|nr:hypothetical protein [Kineococcus xinjiangensis]